MRLLRLILLSVVFSYIAPSRGSSQNTQQKLSIFDESQQNFLNWENPSIDSSNNQLLACNSNIEISSAGKIFRKKDEVYSKNNSYLIDNLTLDGGIIPYLIFFKGSVVPIWLSSKFAYPITHDKLYLGGEAMIGTVFGESNTLIGLVAGNMIIGSPNKHIRLGLGYVTHGYTDVDMDASALLTISGKVRTSRDWYFLADTYIFNTKDGFTAAISLVGRKMMNKIGLDFGLFIPMGGATEIIIAIPWVGIHIPFGDL